MLITKNFVLLNYPKTGSTFTREVVKKLYSDQVEELYLPVSFDKNDRGRNTQHGTFEQIPEQHKSKPIISIIRDPFDRYLSQYFFRWYASHPPGSVDEIKARYPDFPNLKFAQYLDMTDRFSKTNMLLAFDAETDMEIGFQTINFIAFFSADPRDTFRTLINSETDSLPSFSHIHFIHQENLRNELQSFLSEFNPGDQVIEVMSAIKDMNVSRHGDDKVSDNFWSSDLVEKYSHKERYLLNYFPKYKK